MSVIQRYGSEDPDPYQNVMDPEYWFQEGLGSDKLVLGRGAYGTVVLGQWRGHKVAVKVIRLIIKGSVLQELLM